MSKEFFKKDQHQRCDACDFQKLKQLENNPVIRKLRDEIEQYNFKLTECRNQNQMLKRNLQLAKKMICQEVGGANIDFPSLMKYGTESGFKGRQESVLVLKTRVQELKEYIRELEGELPEVQETPSEEFVKLQMPKNKKKLWRMELERRLARESAEKDINPLIQECFELRRNLDAEKNRFRELTEEVKLLKIELQSQTEKNEEDSGIVKSFKTLEKQLEETLAERAEIRQHIDGAHARNQRLAEEVTSLKDELQVVQRKTRDNNLLIDSLTNSHKSIQEAIDSEKAIVQQNVERYKEELKELHQNQVTDLEILNHVQCIIDDRNAFIDQLRIDLSSAVSNENKKKENISKNVEKLPSKETKNGEQSISRNPEKLPTKETKNGEQNSSKNKNKTSKEDETPAPESPEEDKRKSDSEREVQKLRLQCAMYKALCEAAKMESDRLSILITNQDKKMNEIAVQDLEMGRVIMQKNAEKKEMLDKLNKLQRSFSAKRKKGKFLAQPKSRLDELRLRSEAQKEENDFQRNFLRSAACSKAKDLQMYRDFIKDSEHFFEACAKEIKELMASAPADQQSDPPPIEPANEPNN